MITEFGKRLRIIRMENGDLLKDMAALLGVASSFLSAVEVGRKNVPPQWVGIIANHYELDSKSREELRKLAERATTSVKLDMTKANNAQRNAALSFARSFNTLSDADADMIMKLLHKED